MTLIFRLFSAVHGGDMVHGQRHAVLLPLSLVHPSSVEELSNRPHLVVHGHGRDDLRHRIFCHPVRTASISAFHVSCFKIFQK